MFGRMLGIKNKKKKIDQFEMISNRKRSRLCSEAFSDYDDDVTSTRTVSLSFVLCLGNSRNIINFH